MGYSVYKIFIKSLICEIVERYILKNILKNPTEIMEVKYFLEYLKNIPSFASPSL